MERVKSDVGKEIELGIKISTIKSLTLLVSMNKGIKFQHLRFNDKRSSRMHGGHYGCPGPANDHSPEGFSVMSGVFSNRRVTHLRGH